MNVSILGMFNHYFIMSCRKDAYLKECPVEKANIVECLGAKLPLLVSSLPLQGYFGQIIYFLYPRNQEMNIIMTVVSSTKDTHLKSVQQQRQN